MASSVYVLDAPLSQQSQGGQQQLMTAVPHPQQQMEYHLTRVPLAPARFQHLLGKPAFFDTSKGLLFDGQQAYIYREAYHQPGQKLATAVEIAGGGGYGSGSVKPQAFGSGYGVRQAAPELQQLYLGKPAFYDGARQVYFDGSQAYYFTPSSAAGGGLLNTALEKCGGMATAVETGSGPVLYQLGSSVYLA